MKELRIIPNQKSLGLIIKEASRLGLSLSYDGQVAIIPDNKRLRGYTSGVMQVQRKLQRSG